MAERVSRCTARGVISGKSTPLVSFLARFLRHESAVPCAGVGRGDDPLTRFAEARHDGRVTRAIKWASSACASRRHDNESCPHLQHRRHKTGRSLSPSVLAGILAAFADGKQPEARRPLPAALTHGGGRDGFRLAPRPHNAAEGNVLTGCASVTLRWRQEVTTAVGTSRNLAVRVYANSLILLDDLA